MAAPAATPTGKLGDAIELAWKQQRDADASGPAMGLGWMIAGDGQTRWHNGQTGGSRSALFINRELNCTVVVLCSTAVTDAVDQPSIKRPYSLPAPPTEVERRFPRVSVSRNPVKKSTVSDGSPTTGFLTIQSLACQQFIRWPHGRHWPWTGLTGIDTDTAALAARICPAGRAVGRANCRERGNLAKPARRGKLSGRSIVS
jgi:hypothetical protein